MLFCTTPSGIKAWFWDGRSDAFLLAVAWAPVLLAIAGVFWVDGTVRSEDLLLRYLRLPSQSARLLEPLLVFILYLTYASLRMLTGEFMQLQVCIFVSRQCRAHPLVRP